MPGRGSPAVCRGAPACFAHIQLLYQFPIASTSFFHDLHALLVLASLQECDCSIYGSAKTSRSRAVFQRPLLYKYTTQCVV